MLLGRQCKLGLGSSFEILNIGIILWKYSSKWVFVKEISNI